MHTFFYGYSRGNSNNFIISSLPIKKEERHLIYFIDTWYDFKVEEKILTIRQEEVLLYNKYKIRNNNITLPRYKAYFEECEIKLGLVSLVDARADSLGLNPGEYMGPDFEFGDPINWEIQAKKNGTSTDYLKPFHLSLYWA